MKNLKKKIITALLLSALVFTSLTSASCANNSDSNSTTTTTQAVADNNNNSSDDGANSGEENTTTTPEETTEAKILSNVEVKDYGGANYRILGMPRNTSNKHWEAKDLFSEEENADAINDAVYKRNKTIEERFNVVISANQVSGPSGVAKKSIKAGSDDFDVLFDAIVYTKDLATEGYFLNLKNVPNIDLEKPWYDQNANKELSIENKLFVTFSDFTILDKEATWVYLFNKKLISDLSLEDPYQLVREGKWTIEKLTEMCKGAANDLNGDNTMGNDDQYGYMGESFNMYVGIVGCDVSIFTKDADDLPIYNGVPEKAITAYTKLLEVFGSSDLALRDDDIAKKGFTGGDMYTDVMDKSFMENRILFNNAGMNRVMLFRSMDTDFGVIPPPKYDEAQANYYSSITYHAATTLSIPNTVANPEYIGAITEAICAESKYTLIPAYYDTTLKTKLSRDNDSGEMMDIIFANRRYDLGLIYGFGGLDGVFNSGMTKNDPAIVSAIEKKESQVTKALTKIIDAYAKIEG